MQKAWFSLYSWILPEHTQACVSFVFSEPPLKACLLCCLAPCYVRGFLLAVGEWGLLFMNAGQAVVLLLVNSSRRAGCRSCSRHRYSRCMPPPRTYSRLAHGCQLFPSTWIFLEQGWTCVPHGHMNLYPLELPKDALVELLKSFSNKIFLNSKISSVI